MMWTDEQKAEIQRLVGAALYDFGGRLTTLETSVTFGAKEECSSTFVEIVGQFLKDRGLIEAIDRDLPVMHWQSQLVQQQTPEEALESGLEGP